MGSLESKSSPDVERSTSPKTAEESETEKVAMKALVDEDEEAKNLSGIDLVNYKCRRKEKAYKECVSNHYKNFLAGKTMDQEQACGEKFERYRRCYLKGVQKVIWGKDAPPPAKGSVLAKFAQEEEKESS